MKYKNFLLRAVNLLLILGVLWQYQQVALVRAAAVSSASRRLPKWKPTTLPFCRRRAQRRQSRARAATGTAPMRQRLWFWRCHPGVGNHPKRKNDRYCGAGRFR